MLWWTYQRVFVKDKKSLLRSIATVLINSRGGSSTCAQRVSRSRQKKVEQLPHRDEHPRHCTVCSVRCSRSCVECLDPVFHGCPHGDLCGRFVFNVDYKRSCSNDSSSSEEPVCETAEVNIVEEEQNMWRRVKRGTKLQLDAGRRCALLLLSLQRATHLCC